MNRPQKTKKKKKAVKGQNKKKLKKKFERLWGLEFAAFNRGARQYVDQDYVDKLSPEEKKFLSDFNNTYYGNVFPSKSKRGPKTNMFDKAGIPRNEIYDQTNARNRDVHTTNYKMYDNMSAEEDIDSIFDVARKTETNVLEEAQIDYLDFKRLVDKYVKAGLSEEEAREKAITEIGL